MAFIANGVAAFVAYVMFAVAWFRRYLIGPEGMTVGAAMRWGPRQWRFIARFFMLVGLVLLLGFLITGPINLLTSINPALGIFGRAAIVVGTLLITSRLLLVLPAAAVDQKFGFRDAGNVTRGKSWYMLGIYLFSPAAGAVRAGDRRPTYGRAVGFTQRAVPVLPVCRRAGTAGDHVRRHRVAGDRAGRGVPPTRAPASRDHLTGARP